MASTDAARRWYALPHPSTVRLEGGAWRPGTAQVVAADECLAAEAARLQRELAALGIPPGTGSRILLRSAEAPITSSDAASTPGGAVASDEAYAIEVGDDIDIRVTSATGGFRATRQLLHNLRGSCFAIWSDEPGAQTVAEVADGIRAPLRAMAERAWNGGSALTLAEFERADAAIGLPEGASPPG